ncbi:MAG: hypothetical protein K9K38_12940 [Rhodoferax sp.]|nr:hypothetical protein [Rhodoferax sp.]MCF8210284.1 hypothetical protein [Rhodoferax sp.]
MNFDRKTSTLTIHAPLTLGETDALKQLVTTPLAKAAIEAAAIECRTTAITFFKTPAEEGKTLLAHFGGLKLLPSPPKGFESQESR